MWRCASSNAAVAARYGLSCILSPSDGPAFVCARLTRFRLSSLGLCRPSLPPRRRAPWNGWSQPMDNAGKEPPFELTARRAINAGIALARLIDAERAIMRVADKPENPHVSEASQPALALEAVSVEMPPQPGATASVPAPIAPKLASSLARRLKRMVGLLLRKEAYADATHYAGVPEPVSVSVQPGGTQPRSTGEQPPQDTPSEVPPITATPRDAEQAPRGDTDLLRQILLRDDVMQLRLRDVERSLARIAARIDDLTSGGPYPPPARNQSLSVRYKKVRMPFSPSDRRGDMASLMPALRSAMDIHHATQEQVSLLLQRNFVAFDDVHAVRTPNGYLLVPNSDKGLVLALIEARGCLELGTRAIILNLLRPGDLMIDVGANVGTLSLPAADALRGTGQVIAVEPIPRVADLLRETASLNGLDDELVVERCLAGRRNASTAFYVREKTTHSSSWSEGADDAAMIDVVVRPLDDLVAAGTKVCLVKVDAEGDELEVWAGMTRMLAENPDMVVILEFGRSHLLDREMQVDQWFDTLAVSPGNIWEIVEADGTIKPVDRERLTGCVSTNLLLAPAGLPDQLRHRLA